MFSRFLTDPNDDGSSSSNSSHGTEAKSSNNSTTLNYFKHTERGYEGKFPSFLFESTTSIAEKEAWLEDFLETTTTTTTSIATSTTNEGRTLINSTSDNTATSISPSTTPLAVYNHIVPAFLIVLKALASTEAVADAGAPRRADVWMNRLWKLSHRSFQGNATNDAADRRRLSVVPTSECYQCVIQAWANSDKEQVMVVRNRSERWLNDLLEKSGDELLLSITSSMSPVPAPAPAPAPAPTTETIAVTKSNDDCSASSAAHTIPTNYHEGNNYYQTIEPTIECFNAFLDGLTRGRQGKNKRDRQILLDNARLAESILRKLHSIYSHRSRNQHRNDGTSISTSKNTDADAAARPVYRIRPNTDTFNYVIRGWTRCKHERNSHSKAIAILRLMEGHPPPQQQHHQPPDAIGISGKHSTNSNGNSTHHSNATRPNTKSYAMVMDALITEAKRKARQHCNYRKRRARTTPWGYKNNNAAVAPTEDDDASRNGIDEMNEAAAILRYMHDLHDLGVEGVTPNRVAYNILITGWAALASFHDPISRYDHGSRGDSDDGLPNSRNSMYGTEFKAEELLRTMMSHRDSGFSDAAPDVISYERVILAWANSGRPNAGKRALWWLKQLWKDHRQQEHQPPEQRSNLQPTVNTYNMVMKALSCTDGALATENVLLDLGEKYQASTKPEGAAPNEQNRHYHPPGLCPNSESFAIVIRAWLECAKEARNVDDRIASIRRAYEWLSSLQDIENGNSNRGSRSGGDGEQSVLSNNNNDRRQSSEDQGSNLSTAPQLFTGLLSVIKTCARQRPEVCLELAQKVFDDLKRSRHRLDCGSYSILLQVGLLARRDSNDGGSHDGNVDDYDGNDKGNANSNETTNHTGANDDDDDYDASADRPSLDIERLFTECCNDGLVSNVFVRTLVDDPRSRHLLERSLATGGSKVCWPLPPSWSRNLQNDHNRCSPTDLMPRSERERRRRQRHRTTADAKHRQTAPRYDRRRHTA